MDRVGLALKDGFLFEGLSLGIEEGDRIGLVGRNGSGKTSLLRLIIGELEPDRGSIAKKRGLSISFLEQIPAFQEGMSVGDFLYHGAAPEIRLAARRRALGSEGGAEAAALDAALDHFGPVSLENRYLALCGELGLDDPGRAMSSLSGGQAKKAALARAFAASSDLLLLDEPTNHLDLETVEWLEARLGSLDGAFLLVTHDRWFLDAVTTSMLEIDRREIFRHPGNYSTYLERKAERYNSLEKAENRRLANLKIELAWLGRGARARAGKSERRKDEIRKMAASGLEREETQSRFSSVGTRLGRKGLEFLEVSKSWDGKQVLAPFTWEFQPGARVGVIGPNGSGKTTLLRLATGSLEPEGGRIERGSTVKIAIFEQTAASMDPASSVIDIVKDHAERIALGDGTVLTAEDLLERFAFPRDFQTMAVSRLSGGERRRLQLVRLLAEAPNVLLLDEPTNDLDIATIELLEDYLEDFGGSLLVVSHDRAFLDRSCDSLLVLDGRGGLKTFPGGYGDWLAREKEGEKEGGKGEKPLAAGIEARPAKIAPEGKPKQDRLTWSEKRELDALLDEIAALETEKAALEEGFAAGGGQGRDHASQARRHGELGDLIEAKLLRWEALASRES